MVIKMTCKLFKKYAISAYNEKKNSVKRRAHTLNLCLICFWKDQVVCKTAKGKIDTYAMLILFFWFLRLDKWTQWKIINKYNLVYSICWGYVWYIYVHL